MNSRAPASVPRSIGIGLLVLSRSLSPSVGIFANAAGGSGVSCSAFRRAVSSTISSRSSSSRPAATRSSRVRSSATSSAARLGSGLSSHRGAMRVVDEMLADQLLEHRRSVRKLRLERGQRPLVGQRLERIAAMQPAAERAEHQRHAARERAGVVFAQRELETVHRGFDRQRIDARGDEAFERVEDQRLDLAGIGRVDPLHAHREERLAEIVGEARAGEPFPEPGIGERLPQRRRGVADQHVLEHGERKHRLWIVELVEHPVDGDHAGLLADVALGGGIGALDVPRLAPARLQPHLGIDGRCLELARDTRQAWSGADPPDRRRRTQFWHWTDGRTGDGSS